MPAYWTVVEPGQSSVPRKLSRLRSLRGCSVYLSFSHSAVCRRIGCCQPIWRCSCQCGPRSGWRRCIGCWRSRYGRRHSVIAGGGAVLGLVGGSGVMVVASLLSDSKGAFALDECSKLLTFCQSDFAQADMKPEAIERMQQGLLDQSERMETQQEVLSGRSGDKDLDKAEKDETKKELSGLKKSLGCMRNCENELVKLINQKVTRGRLRLPPKAMLDWPDQ